MLVYQDQGAGESGEISVNWVQSFRVFFFFLKEFQFYKMKNF